MKSRIFTIALLLIILQLYAQNTPIESINKKVVGKNFILQNNINANEFNFSKRIHRLYIDSISGYATIQLRKLSKNGKLLGVNGQIIVYDLKNQKIKWTKKIDYSNSSLRQYNDIIILSKGNNSIRLDNENGSTIWKIKNDFYYVDPSEKIGIGYKYNGLGGHLHTLERIDLKNGNTIWERELNREYGWNKIKTLNESDLLIVAGGLHVLNKKTGLGWDYETVTGKKDYTETIAKNVGGIALGVLTGTYVVSSGSNLVRDINSNVIIDSINIYFASKEKLSKINRVDGSIVWSYNLPEKLMSKSSILEKDSTLLLLNKGYAYWKNKSINFGEPFMLLIDKITGKKIYYKTFDEKENPIYDSKLENDSLLLLFSNKLEKYTLKNGSLVSSKSFNSEQFGTFKFFIANQLYTKSDDPILKYHTLNDSVNYFAQTSLSKTLKIDTNLNLLHEYDFEDLYLVKTSKINNTFLNKGDITIIIDLNGHPIAELNMSFPFTIFGNKLYGIKENQLLEVDLTELMNAVNQNNRKLIH